MTRTTRSRFLAVCLLAILLLPLPAAAVPGAATATERSLLSSLWGLLASFLGADADNRGCIDPNGCPSGTLSDNRGAIDPDGASADPDNHGTIDPNG